MEQIRKVDRLSDPGLAVYVSRSEGELKRDPGLGLFIAESPKVIGRALAAGYEPVSFLMETGMLTGEGRQVLERCCQVPVYTAEDEVLTKLTGFHLTRGMLCAMKRKPLLAPEALIQTAQRIVVLEDVVNPTNVGAILRSAAALNVDAVLLTPACADPLYRRAARVSMGCVFQIPWTFFEKDFSFKKDGPDLLKHCGFKTAALALREQSISIADPRLAGEKKLALLLGTEGDGLAASTIDGCDYTVKIPMTGGVDSLNVAAASAVAFWQICAQRDR